MTREVPGFKVDYNRDGLRKLTLREMIGQALVKSALKSHDKKKSKSGAANEPSDHSHDEHDHSHGGYSAPEGAKIHHLAMVVVGEVFDIIRAETKLADTFLSQPKFVEFDSEKTTVAVGYKYVDGEFIPNE